MANVEKTRILELLAPAKNCEIGREAIIHGADAVYIGADAFGARSAATNSADNIAALVEFAHKFNARVYVTVNTLIYDDEIQRVEKLVSDLYRVGVDALIVQDMALLEMNIPPIALHASTQCDTRSPEKARFLSQCGFSQIVLPREMSLDQIKAVAQTVDVPLEVFVHGALCVSYSGDCQASLLATGRSANRGECAQMCRLPYTLTDASGRKLAAEAHYLSLRDMNRIDRLADLIEVGASSFKIEGRLKDADYVKNVVAAYSQALDELVDASDGKLKRLSSGRIDYKFTPDLHSVFNRNFTQYFLDGRPSDAVRMSSRETPKWIGQPVATVVDNRRNVLEVKAKMQLSNGDGLGYFNREGQFCGFRLNRVDGNNIYPATAVDIPIGTELYRNRDKQRDDLMSKTTALRSITLSAYLRPVGKHGIALKLTDDRGVSAEVALDCELQPAKTPQKRQRINNLCRLGDTIYTLDKLRDEIGDNQFVAASKLAELRRSAVAALDSARRANYKFDYRRSFKAKIESFKPTSLDRHDNVANHLAAEFYKKAGMQVAERAAEVTSPDPSRDFRVMTTRYCLRRELGACLKTPNAKRLPSPLFLKSSGLSYRLDFDCAACQMHVVVPACKNVKTTS